MSSKKKMKRLDRCMRRFVEHTGHMDGFAMQVDGDEVDASAFVAGMQAMAGYVGTVIEGELNPDDDPERMLRVLLSVAWLAWSRVASAEGGDDDAE